MSMPSRGLLFASSLLLAFACSSSSSTTDAGNVAGAGGSAGADSAVAGTGGSDSAVAESGVAGDSGALGDTSASDGAEGDAAAGDAGPPATFTQVYTIISNRCSPCHTMAGGMGVVMGHLDMTSQAAAFMNLVNVPAAGVACTGKGMRVTPGMPDSSVMYLKISLDDPAPCGMKMPLGRTPLPQAEADTIESWINGGAMNN
jgi:hypothetical protein